MRNLNKTAINYIYIFAIIYYLYIRAFFEEIEISFLKLKYLVLPEMQMQRINSGKAKM